MDLSRQIEYGIKLYAERKAKDGLSLKFMLDLEESFRNHVKFAESNLADAIEWKAKWPDMPERFDREAEAANTLARAKLQLAEIRRDLALSLQDLLKEYA